jgi:hypothetical protein
LALYLAGLTITVAAVTTAVDHLLSEAGQSLPAVAKKAAAEPVSQVLAGPAAVQVPTLVQKTQYWSGKGAPVPPRPAQPPQVQSLGIFGLFQPIEPPPPPPTFATVCVRMCDGFYFPVSFSTTSDNFASDERKCQASCGSQARLFTYRTQGGSPEDMRDVRGQPYNRLPTAFLYRTSYNESCKCKPHPWEQEATDRHRMYALEQSVKKGDTKKVAELKVLQEKLKPEPAALKSGTSIAQADETSKPVQPRKEPPGKMSLGSQSKGSSTNPAWRDRVFNTF